MLPITGRLDTNMIADELGYTMSVRHNLAGGFEPSTNPINSLTYFYRPGNVFTSGVPQDRRPFGMSAFHGQAALYKCIGLSANDGVTGSATIVSYYKNTISVTFSNSTTYYCVRQNWDGNLALSNLTNATYSIGGTCSGVTIGGTSSVRVSNPQYGKYGVLLYKDTWQSSGIPSTPGDYAYFARTSLNDSGTWGPTYGIGTYSNNWWANPNYTSSYGRLNKCGIWRSASSFAGDVFDINFSYYSQTNKTYYVG